MTAYRSQDRELTLSDSVRVTANDRSLGLVNGDRATISGLDSERQTITLGMADGRQVILDASQPVHLDHGYASTVHAAQGQTADRVLIDADTRSATANESAYYVAISRARDEVKVFTDDKQALPDSMSREDTKSAALELAANGRGADYDRV
jgi:ATP-dependent exoDNAse (exonuclease V) alpha subunit